MSGIVCDNVEARSKVLKTTEKASKNKACLRVCRPELALVKEDCSVGCHVTRAVGIGQCARVGVQVVVPQQVFFQDLVGEERPSAHIAIKGLFDVPRVDMDLGILL